MNIILCGMMGVGKSSVGACVSSLTGRRWVDTDAVISGRHGTISDLFECYGEAYFRQLERGLVGELEHEDGLVVSTGGGLVLDPVNAAALRRNGKIFFLRASFETLLSRVRADVSRPLLKDTGRMRETLSSLLAARTPVYESVADHIVDTDGCTAEEAARQIVALAEGGVS